MSDHRHSLSSTSSQPKRISTHPHPSQTTSKKCSTTSTQPKYTFPHPHLYPSTHRKCPLSPAYQKYTSTYAYPPLFTYKKCLHPNPPFHKMYPSNGIHPKYTFLINVLKCFRTAFNTTVPLLPTNKEKRASI